MNWMEITSTENEAGRTKARSLNNTSIDREK